MRSDALENPESWEPYFDLVEIASMRRDVEASVEHLRDARERRSLSVTGRQTLVFLNTQDGWKIIHEHGTVRRS